MINAAKKPTTKYEAEGILVTKYPEITSLAILPKINGITIKNENLAASALDTPNINDVEMVAPDLEIPGRIAIA